MKKKIRITIIGTCLIFAIVMMTVGQVVAYDPNIVARKTGHRFIESSWAIEYDVLSNKLVEDLTPGEFADQLNDTDPDRAPYHDANFYIAYINLGQVQTMYMAFKSYSLNNRNSTYYGVSPYQILQQHFRTPGGKHVIVQNSFSGLVAYREDGYLDGVPDKNDSLFYGSSLNSQFHKYLINWQLKFSSLGYAALDMENIPTATPKVLENTTNNEGEIEYTFGMDYENIFVLWHRMDVDQNLNGTITGRDLLDKVVAFSTIDYLNFTYKLSGKMVEDKAVNITTITEYDIGPLSDLWIIDDSQTKTEEWNGDYINLYLKPGTTVSHYNTSQSIENRLNGDEEVPGFSLAVANYFRMTVISGEITEQEDVEISDGKGDNVDGNDANRNVTKLNIKTSNEPAYKIDFESKPNYTLDGTESMRAPVKLYPNLNIKDKSINRIDGLAMLFLNSITRAMVKARIEHINENFDLEGKQINIDVNRRNVFYAICFPKWGGKAIYQDPKFTAVSEPPEINTGLGGNISGFIDSYGLFVLLGIGACTSFILIRKINKKNRN